MAENKMAQVAAMFGVKLNEEFKIKYGKGLAFEAVVKFTKKNFRVSIFRCKIIGVGITSC